MAGPTSVFRRQLNRRFQESLSRTPNDEIQRIRFRRIKELLTSTDLSLTEIAPMAFRKRHTALEMRDARW